MTHYYRRKPVTVTAFDFSITQVDERSNNLFDGIEDGKHYIETLEGRRYIRPDDFIIRGILGTLYPVRRDDFLESYTSLEGYTPTQASNDPKWRKYVSTLESETERCQEIVEKYAMKAQPQSFFAKIWGQACTAFGRKK